MGGIQPNVIPDLAQIWWYVRDSSGPAAKDNFDKLVNIAKGAALMTGTTYDMEYVASAWPQLGNRALGEALQKNIDIVGHPKWSDDEIKFAQDFQTSLGVKAVGLITAPSVTGDRSQAYSSNDNGDVTWNVPSGIFNFPSRVPGVAPHNWQAGVTPTSSIAHKGEVAGAKVLAATLLDLLTTPEVLNTSRAEFDRATKDSKYFSLMPADAKPPLDMNRDMMEKFRPEMRKYYLNKTPRFQ